MVKFEQFFLMSKFNILLLMLAAALTMCSFACSSADAEYRAAVEKLQIDQEIQEIRLKLSEEKLAEHENRLNGLQRTVEVLLERLPAPVRTQVAAAQNVAPVKQQEELKVQVAGRATAAGQTSSGQTATGAAQQAGKPAAGQSSGQAAKPAAQTAERTAYNSALAALEAGQPVSAEKMFGDFLRAYPKSTLAPNAEYWLGECFYTQKRYGEAILAFQNVAAQYPTHNKAAAALLKTGYSYERLADKQNAIFYLQQLLEQYPQSEPAPLAKNALSRLR